MLSPVVANAAGRKAALLPDTPLIMAPETKPSVRIIPNTDPAQFAADPIPEYLRISSFINVLFSSELYATREN